MLTTACQGGNPPDLAAVGQPALVEQLANLNCAKPIEFAKADLLANFAKSWVDLGSPDVAASARFYTQLFGWDHARTGADFGAIGADRSRTLLRKAARTRVRCRSLVP